jgi:hypothetical protein
VINGTSLAPSHVYSTGIVAPSLHGPENCSCVASVPSAAADEVVGDGDVVDGELVDEVEVLDDDDVVVEVSGMTSGGAVVVVVDVDVVVCDSR